MYFMGLAQLELPGSTQSAPNRGSYKQEILANRGQKGPPGSILAIQSCASLYIRKTPLITLSLKYLCFKLFYSMPLVYKVVLQKYLSNKKFSRIFSENHSGYKSWYVRSAAINRALEMGVSVRCRGQIFYSVGCQLENHSVECPLGIITLSFPRLAVLALGVWRKDKFWTSGVGHFLPSVGWKFLAVSGVGITSFMGPINECVKGLLHLFLTLRYDPLN